MDYRMKQEVKREIERVLAKAAEVKVVVEEAPVVVKKVRVRKVRSK